MARVPTYDVPTEELKPTPIDPKTAATLGGEVVDLGEGISALGDKINKLQNLTNENNAIKYLSDSNNATHDYFYTTPNLDDAEDKSSEQLDKNYNNALNMIKNPEAREKAADMLLRMRDSKQTAINSMIQGRKIANFRTSIRPTNDSFQTQYNGANSPQQEQHIKDLYNKWMDKQSTSDAVPLEIAENLRQTQMYEFGNRKAQNDIQLAPTSKIISTIKDKIANGDYGDLRTQDYSNLMNKADRRSQFLDVKLQRNMNNIQSRNARDLQQMSMTNNPNMEQHAEELYYQGQISQRDFKLYTGKKPIINPSTDGASYNESLAYLSDPKTSMDDARRFIQGKYNQNLLSPEDRDKLYNLRIKPYGNDYKNVKDVIGTQEAKSDESHFFKRTLNAAREVLNSYTKIPGIGDKLPPNIFGQPASKTKMDDDKDAEMAKRFVQKISDKNPEDYISAAHEVVNEQRLIDRPEVGGYPEEGTTEQDDNGVRSTTKPDGSTQQEDNDDPYGG